MEKHPLHIKTPELQKSEEVDDAVEKKERLESVEIPNNPNERIEAYMDRLENVFLNPDERVRERNLEMLRDKIYDALIIKPENFPESYFELQKRIARERGQVVEEIPEETREQMMEVAIGDQKASLDAWVDYLTSDDAVYPPWFKYYTWNQIIKLSQFDKERGEFKKRTNSTVAPFSDIYREPLAQIADAYEKVKEDNKNLNDAEVQEIFSKKFPTIYAELIQKTLEGGIENQEEVRGEWVKYEQGKEGDADKLFKSLENKKTGWCTAGKSTAKIQIKSGDFYVYYTNDSNGEPTQPRLAIRLNGKNQIGEVRGILPHQNIESQMQEVLDNKLQEFGTEADAYRKKSHDMKLLTEIDNKTKSGEELTIEDIVFLYEIKNSIESFGYGKDPRIEQIKSKRNKNNDYSSICVYILDNKDKFDEYIYKAAVDENKMIDLYRKYNNKDPFTVDDLRFLYQIDQPIQVLFEPSDRDQYLISKRNIKEDVSKALDVSEDQISINEAEAMKGGMAYHYGDISISHLKSAEGLILPQIVNGDVYLSELISAKGLTLPKNINGTLHLRELTSAEWLTLPESVGEDLYMWELTSAEGLTMPKSVGGNLNLYSLRSAEGLTMPKSVGKDLDLENLRSAEGLTLPESVGGSLNLYHLRSVEGLTMPKSVGKDLTMRELTSAEGLTLPESVGRNLDLNNLRSAEGLTLPESVGRNLDLYNLRSAEGLTMPKNVGGEVTLRYRLEGKEELEKKYPYLKIDYI